MANTTDRRPVPSDGASPRAKLAYLYVASVGSATPADVAETLATDWRVQVFLRERIPPAVSETVDEAIDRLRALERDGDIGALRVDSWGVRGGRHVDADGAAASTIEEFESWADRTDRSLAPAFDRREVSSMFCERPVERIDVPIFSIAVYAGDRLKCVTPCSDGDQTYTARDCIDALATDGDEAVEDADAPAANDPIVDAGRS